MREASCSCGQLRVEVEGDPLRVSICHCRACQRRTGSPFGEQARFERSQATFHGTAREHVRWSEEDEPEKRTFSFCPECGSTVFYRFADETEMFVIPVGAFADPSFPAPVRSVWEESKHPWVQVPPGAERHS